MSKHRLRFEVLKRDNFTCQYCGAKAPDAVLHVDHVHPAAKGGGNDMSNLRTSCLGCNYGKAGTPISVSAKEEKADRAIEEQIRLILYMPDPLMAAINERWHKLELPSRAATVRKLLEEALSR